MSAIDDKYALLGGAVGFLGKPITAEISTPDGLGLYRHYDGGSIYQKRTFPIAFEVHGLIRDKWAAAGWELSSFGFPLTDEVSVQGGNGRLNVFEAGAIAWTPSNGTHEVHGAIYQRLTELERQQSGGTYGERLISSLGFPLTDELTTPDGRGRYNHFEYGSIYWTPTTGAHEVKGDIKDSWAAAGWELGPLGYPIDNAGRMVPTLSPTDFQDFEHGTLYNWLGTSRTVIRGPALTAIAGYMIDWSSLVTLLPDRDRISATFSGHHPDSDIHVTLNAGPGISSWKAVCLWSPTRGDILETWTEGNTTTNSMMLPPSLVEASDLFLLFKKGKFLSVHTGMYWLGRADRLIGNNVTFTWLQDA